MCIKLDKRHDLKFDRKTNEISIDRPKSTAPTRANPLALDRPVSKDGHVMGRRGLTTGMPYLPSKKAPHGAIKLAALKDVPKILGTKEGQIATLMAPYLKKIVQHPDKLPNPSRSA